MNYISTRGNNQKMTSAQAIIAGGYGVHQGADKALLSGAGCQGAGLLPD